MTLKPRTRSRSASESMERGIERPATAKMQMPEIIALDLFAMELAVRGPDEQASVDRGDIRFECSVRRVENGVDKRRDFIFVNFIVSREPSLNPTETVSASYLCFFERTFEFISENECSNLFKSIVNMAVWPRFKDLLGLLVTQGNLAIPKPPLVLENISWNDATSKGG